MKDPLKYLLEHPPETKEPLYYDLIGITVFAVFLFGVIILLTT